MFNRKSDEHTLTKNDDFLKGLLVTLGYYALFSLLIFIPLVGFLLIATFGAYLAGQRGGRYVSDWALLGLIAAIIWTTMILVILLYILITVMSRMVEYPFVIGGFEVAIIFMAYALNILFCVMGTKSRSIEKKKISHSKQSLVEVIGAPSEQQRSVITNQQIVEEIEFPTEQQRSVSHKPEKIQYSPSLSTRKTKGKISGTTIAIVVSVIIIVVGVSSFFAYQEFKDTDGDGVPDKKDIFPNDSDEWEDSDSDGVGDNGDVFPNDASETADTDGDGIGDNGDLFPEDVNDPDYAIGDKWTVKSTDEDFENPWIFEFIVTSLSYMYNGEEVVVEDWVATMEGWTEDSGIIWDNWTGTGTEYLDKSNDDNLYAEREIETRVKYHSNDDWHEIRTRSISYYQNSGTFPSSMPNIGDSWVTTETETSNTTTWMDSEIVSQEEETETETKNWEVLSKKSISVEAGTFECLEIRYDVVEADSYSLGYYSPKAKAYVKNVKYVESDFDSMMELITYNIS